MAASICWHTVCWRVGAIFQEVVMATVVTGDVLKGLAKKGLEIVRQLMQKEGYPFSLDELDPALQALTEGRFGRCFGKSVSEILAPELVGDLVVVREVLPKEFEVADLEFFPAPYESWKGLKEGEQYDRIVQLGAHFGLLDGKRILARQAEIPEELRHKLILLPGTRLNWADRVRGRDAFREESEMIEMLEFSHSTGGWYMRPTSANIALVNFPNYYLVRLKSASASR